jgi:hypothetical protein
MAGAAPVLVRRLAGATAAVGLTLAGLVVAATPASAAACSGTSGVTVVVDTGSSTSTRCASGDPSSAMKALTGAGFSVTTPQMYPGSVVCRINGYPESDPCVRMPPADAYWAFFQAKRGGSWTYSSTGVTSYDPASGTVVGFRFGSGQQPRTDPPEPTATSQPDPTRTTTAPTKTTSAPRTTAPGTTSGTAGSGTKGSGGSTGGSATASGRPSATASPTTSATATTPSASATSTGGGSTPTTVAAAPTSQPDDGSAGLRTLLLGGALVALVAAGAAWAAWKRRA